MIGEQLRRLGVFQRKDDPYTPLADDHSHRYRLANERSADDTSANDISQTGLDSATAVASAPFLTVNGDSVGTLLSVSTGHVPTAPTAGTGGGSVIVFTQNSRGKLGGVKKAGSRILGLKRVKKERTAESASPEKDSKIKDDAPKKEEEGIFLHFLSE